MTYTLEVQFGHDVGPRIVAILAAGERAYRSWFGGGSNGYLEPIIRKAKDPVEAEFLAATERTLAGLNTVVYGTEELVTIPIEDQPYELHPFRDAPGIRRLFRVWVGRPDLHQTLTLIHRSFFVSCRRQEHAELIVAAHLAMNEHLGEERILAVVPQAFNPKVISDIAASKYRYEEMTPSVDKAVLFSVWEYIKDHYNATSEYDKAVQSAVDLAASKAAAKPTRKKTARKRKS